MTTSPTDLSFDETISVWLDLERALEGRHSYGGDVAEIYAYRLLPATMPQCTSAEQAGVAGRNLTRILRQFVELRAGVSFEIEGPGLFQPLDLAGAGCPPFTHRVHLRVSQERRIREQFGRDLLALWSRAADVKLPRPPAGAWDGVTKDLLTALGMEWDVTAKTYVLRSKA